MRGPFLLSKGIRYEDLFDRRVVVCRNTRPLKNRQRQADYIWCITDPDSHRVLALATEVPLVGAPLTYMPGMNPAVAGHIPPGQLVLKDAHVVLQRDWVNGPRPRAVILTSDGEIWTSHGRQPAVKYRAY